MPARRTAAAMASASASVAAIGFSHSTGSPAAAGPTAARWGWLGVAT